jgi:uncharacterized protein YhaN
MAHLEQLRELQNKLREVQQRLQQLRQALEREAAGKALEGGARAKARDVQHRIEEDADAADPPPQSSESKSRNSSTIAPHYARALHRRRTPHPWKTSGASGMCDSLAGRELCFSAPRARFESSGGALSLREGILGASCAYQSEGIHGARTSPRQPPTLCSS